MVLLNEGMGLLIAESPPNEYSLLSSLASCKPLKALSKKETPALMNEDLV